VDTGIRTSRSYEEWEAAREAGLDLYKWETGYYPNWFRAKIVAYRRCRKLIELHTYDAGQVHSKSRSKRRN
jgi:hypothetical protein